MSNEERLENWERILYQSGYMAALAEAGRVVMAHARAKMGTPDCDPYVDAALEITKLMNTTVMRGPGETLH